MQVLIASDKFRSLHQMIIDLSRARICLNGEEMAQSSPVECEYLVDGELCKSVITDEEGKATRQKWCMGATKNLCCYLCARRDSCEISCSYLDRPESSQTKAQASVAFDSEIEACKKRIDRLAVLLADGKISEQSYATATRTLESKIKSLEQAKENPNVLASSTGVETSEDASLERPTALWYLVPFFFGLIGGLIGYVGVKDEDKGMADSLLVFGLVWTFILAIIYYVFITSLLSSLPV